MIYFKSSCSRNDIYVDMLIKEDAPFRDDVLTLEEAKELLDDLRHAFNNLQLTIQKFEDKQ